MTDLARYAADHGPPPFPLLLLGSVRGAARPSSCSQQSLTSCRDGAGFRRALSAWLDMTAGRRLLALPDPSQPGGCCSWQRNVAWVDHRSAGGRASRWSSRRLVPRRPLERVPTVGLQLPRHRVEASLPAAARRSEAIRPDGRDSPAQNPKLRTQLALMRQFELIEAACSTIQVILFYLYFILIFYFIFYFIFKFIFFLCFIYLICYY